MNRLCALLLGLALGFTACGGPAREIVGKWRVSGGEADNVIWEFSPDGVVTIAGTRGRYSFGDQGRIKIETPFANSVYRIEISGDRMTLTDRAPLSLVRVK